MIKIDIEKAKKQVFDKIKEAFERELAEGTIDSSLGFKADCRRSGTKNDKDNLESLIKLRQFPIYWKDADGNVHALSEEQANILLQEMINKGLWCYQHKWEKEQQIENATTLEELEAIKW